MSATLTSRPLPSQLLTLRPSPAASRLRAERKTKISSDFEAPLSLEEFTCREQQIIELLLRAKSTKEIAAELNLTLNTIKDYLKTIYSKGQVHSARELMVRLATPAVQESEASESLLAAMEEMLNVVYPQDALRVLPRLVAHCTQARRVDVWRLQQLGANRLLRRYPDDAQRLVLSGGTLAQALQQHALWMNGQEFFLAVDRVQLEHMGCRRELVVIEMAFRGEVFLLLATDPQANGFSGECVAKMRVLCRLAEATGARAGLAIAASA